ncbi:MAG TPA: DNA cytosine methyltransferase, partial [Phycisphaerae bacterium]|nr:DNA cytosine methyltransferase [Phycisphaerae bacterium]
GDAYADRAAEESNLILGTPLVSLTCGDRGLSPDQVAGGMALATRFGVRRLTPRECERLQGFADDYTLIPYRGKPAKDGPRYRAIGNSMARPVMAWIGKRIDELEGPR